MKKSFTSDILAREKSQKHTVVFCPASKKKVTGFMGHSVNAAHVASTAVLLYFNIRDKDSSYSIKRVVEGKWKGS